MKTKKITQVVILLCGLFVCFSCTRKEKTEGEVRLVLDWTPNTNHTGLYAALENGYFAEAGLSVSIMQPPEDGALLLTAAGGAEFAVDFQETMGPAIARKRDALPLTAVAAIINHNTSGIMSLASRNIRQPRDLVGARFGSWETPLVTEIIRSIVEADGGDFNAVSMIPNYATDAISALQTDIDAIWIYYAWDGVKARLSGVDINYMDFGKLNPVFDFYTPVLVVNTEYAKKNPDEVRRFLAAVSKGYNYAVEYPEAAAEILLKNAPELDAELVNESQRYLAPRYTAEGTRWGEIDGGRWDGFYGWMFEKGLLESDLRGKGYTNEYLP
ncbi:MAG: ABC transporter substrate-binding protein [Spirochaetaceae bacterium]|jgi:ABC-type nitrate/sulfonate/bicarbonate transport system substrate-binding protein|nr:ABC transporter substrate-binding protein [Spirochaetaceae bacterium]